MTAAPTPTATRAAMPDDIDGDELDTENLSSVSLLKEWAKTDNYFKKWLAEEIADARKKLGIDGLTGRDLAKRLVDRFPLDCDAGDIVDLQNCLECLGREEEAKQAISDYCDYLNARVNQGAASNKEYEHFQKIGAML